MESLRVEKLSLDRTIASVDLTYSKSITNRALLLQKAIGKEVELSGISPSNDSLVMQKILQSNSDVWDVEDAGTAFRFLVAYACFSGKSVVIKGTERLHERPIKPLVDTLQAIGFQITYLAKPGFAPLQIHGTIPKKFPDKISIDCSQSSQFASGILLVSPMFPHPVELELSPENPASLPYIETTVAMLNAWGIPARWISKNCIRTAPKSDLSIHTYVIEKDWSSAGFWYEMVCFHPGIGIHLKGLHLNSIQADRVTALFFSYLGIETVESESGLYIHHSGKIGLEPRIFDLKDSPDLFPCLALSLAALPLNHQDQFSLTGLQTLQYKESNRLEAVRNELQKLGVRLYETEPGFWKVSGDLLIGTDPVSSYQDHRITMAFAIAGTKLGLCIEQPETVQKSYPGFWEELKKVSQQ
ncbi:MAG: hypothetical protein K1X82_07055 [Bacteroidia bacterium]|nr:hypothetical protein [Bacteroidia bacterium]